MNVAQAEKQINRSKDTNSQSKSSPRLAEDKSLHSNAASSARNSTDKTSIRVDGKNLSVELSPQASSVTKSTSAETAEKVSNEQVWPNQHALWFALFAALNTVLFELSLLTPFYRAISDGLRSNFAFIKIVLTAALTYIVVFPKALLALKEIRLFLISSNLLETLALTLSLGYSIFSVAFEFHVYAQQPIFKTFSLLCLVIVLKDLLLKHFEKRLAKSRAFQVKEQVGRIRLINSTPNLDQHLVANAAATNSEIPDSQYTWVDAKHAKPGDTFYVMADELIPCDAVVLSGSGEVQERKLTALFYTRFKRRADEVFAGSRVVSGSLTCKVTLALDDSNASAMEEIVKGSLTALNDHQARNIKLQNYYNLGLIILTGFVAQFWLLQGAKARTVADISVAMLLVGIIPLALKVAPELVRLAVASAFKKGVILKDCRVLDRLSYAKTLAIDFRPEDQIGEPSVTNFEIVDTRIDEKGMLGALSVLLSQSEDPLHHSALEFFRVKVSFSPINLEVKDFKNYPGFGLCGLVEGADFTVGSEEFLLARGVQLQSSEILAASDKETHLYVALGEDLIARFSIAAGLRAYGPPLIKELRDARIRTIILSEAESRIVDPIGKSMGLELADIHAGLDRASLIKKIQTFEPLALFATPKTCIEKISESSSSISVFDELLWDAKRTDVTLFRNDFGLIAKLIKLSRQVQRILGENRFYAVMLSAMLIVSAGSGLMPSSLVALSMLLSVSLLYWNSLRVG